MSVQHPQRRRRILVVDDHADTRDLLVRLLARRYDVATAACYDSALASAAAATPQVVITDVGLPGRDGMALMRELHSRYGVTGIAVTGHEIDDAAAYRDAGFLHWLRKPIRLDQLVAALEEAQAVA